MAIYARTRKRDGITVFECDFTDQNGDRRREVAGTTRKQAKAKLAQRLGEVRAGTYRPKREVKRAAEAAKGPTFADFGERFLRDYAATRRSDFYAQRVALLRAREPFKSKRLGELTRSDLDAYLARRLKEPERGARGLRKAGPATVRRELAVLRVMFKMAVRWGVLAASPVTDLAAPREPDHKLRWLTRGEYDRLHDGAPPWLRPMLRLAAASGMRLKEVVSLRWDDIDTGRGLIHVTTESKTGRGRAIPMTTAAREVLDAVPKRVPRSVFVFVDSAGTPYTGPRESARVSTFTRAAASRAGLPGVSFHTLRHTAASWLVQAGVPLYEVQAILGHSTPVMTQRYAHLAPDHLRDAAAALDAALAAVPASAGENGKLPAGNMSETVTPAETRSPEAGRASEATA